jgi:hypothetical protein
VPLLEPVLPTDPARRAVPVLGLITAVGLTLLVRRSPERLKLGGWFRGLRGGRRRLD